MTSILDQYERASKQVINFKISREIITLHYRLGFLIIMFFKGGSTVFMNAMLEHERPMFAKQKVAFTPQFPARHMSAQSGRITLILVNNILLRIDTRSPDNVNGEIYIFSN